MKSMNFSIFLKAGIAFISFLSCGKSNPVETPVTLPADIYTVTALLDIGNSNTAADIRAEVKFLQTANVSDILEARFVLVKSSKTFSENQIKDLKSGNYGVIPVANTPLQIIKPANTLKDADGDLFVNGTTYNAYIAILGKGNTLQLSKPKALLLSNKSIYAGKYVGTWEDLGPPGPGKFPMSLIIKEDYTGQMFYASETFVPYGKGGATEDAKTVMAISGSTFTFKLDVQVFRFGNGVS